MLLDEVERARDEIVELRPHLLARQVEQRVEASCGVGRRQLHPPHHHADPLQLLGRDVDAVQTGEHPHDLAHRREHVLVEDDEIAAVAAHAVVDPARRHPQVRLDQRAPKCVRVLEHPRADRLVALLAEEDDRLLDAAKDVEARRVEALARERAVDQLVEPAQPHVRDVGLDRAEAVLLETRVAGIVLDPGEAVAVLRGPRRLEPVPVDLVPVDDRVDVRPAVGDALGDRAAEHRDRCALPVRLDVAARELEPPDGVVVQCPNLHQRGRGALTTTRCLRSSAGIDAIERTPSTTGPSCRSISSRLPKRSSLSSKKRIVPPRSAASKLDARFFSVSPMYFETTSCRADDGDAHVAAGREQLLQLVHLWDRMARGHLLRRPQPRRPDRGRRARPLVPADAHGRGERLRGLLRRRRLADHGRADVGLHGRARLLAVRGQADVDRHARRGAGGAAGRGAGRDLRRRPGRAGAADRARAA